MENTFYLQRDNIYAVPTIHHNIETAAAVLKAFLEIQPDAVAVELPGNAHEQHMFAASRLPDLSVIATDLNLTPSHLYLCASGDGLYEGLRCALDNGIPGYCIDLDVKNYPSFRDLLPDPYAIRFIGFEAYFNHCRQSFAKNARHPLDSMREEHMAKQLKEISLRHDRVLFVCGMAHVTRVLSLTQQSQFPVHEHTERQEISLFTLTQDSSREVLPDPPYYLRAYEEWRTHPFDSFPDRQSLLLSLYQDAKEPYEEKTGNPFPGYHLRNLMKFSRNYALITHHLTPDLFQILAAAKGCVDHNYAYEVWALATHYPELKNIDLLPELNLTPEQLWGYSKRIFFHLKSPSRKISFLEQHHRKKQQFRFQPMSPFGICSYQPEDLIIENFGRYLQKKGAQLISEEGAHVIPFSTSLEDGIDTRETIRHWAEKKLYVKRMGRPHRGVGAVVVIFDEDRAEDDDHSYKEKYSWKVSWLGEHEQESDMAFYATPPYEQIIGPGICRCEYGGFMMSYPPRRLFDIWHDPQYIESRSKSELLLMAAIDYAVKPLIVYTAAKPPRSKMKQFASRFGKKIVYQPIGQLSPITLNKIRVFHVLDGHDKRLIADEFIE
ncbi:MAG: hypothetical protein Tsb0021_06520 [Chlamydiales bacterium]